MRATISADNKIILSFNYNRQIVDEFKSICPARFEPTTKNWELTPTYESIQWVMDSKFYVAPEDFDKFDKLIDFVNHQQKIKSVKKSLSHAIAADVVQSVYDKLKPDFREKVQPYQWVPCHYALAGADRFGIFDPMGLGKSAQAVMVSMLPANTNSPVLIVCPANNTGTWATELARNFGAASYVVTSQFTHLIPGVRFYICSYDRLKHIQAKNDFFLIIDEAQMVKNRSTQRYKHTYKLAKQCRKLVALTGTPMDNRPEELYAIFSLIDLNFMSWYDFCLRYCNMRRTPFGINVTGCSNPVELYNMTYDNYAIRRSKKEVLPQLPDKVREVIDLGYREISADTIFELYSKNAHIKSADTVFLEWLVDTISDNEKIIIFFHHQVMFEALKKLCATHHFPYMFIDGSVDGVERDKRVEEFQNNPKLRVALLSMTAAKTGLTLTAANVEVFVELPFSPGVLEQCEDRAHRLGQKSAVTILKPRVSRFDTYLSDMLISKLGVIARVVEGIDYDTADDETLLTKMSKDFGIPIGRRKAA